MVGNVRGFFPSNTSAIARICSGLVPQQPPAILSRFSVAKSATIDDMFSGVSSYPPNSLGSPALGCTLTGQSATRDSSTNQGRNSVAPKAQFKPIDIGFACLTEFQNASTVCP